MQDDGFRYHNCSDYVYTDNLTLELGAIWDGINRLERGGTSLDAIARSLTLDWETSLSLAMIGRRP
ncbi:MAG: hypothetical protein AUI16_16730 [Alphaproteobacteria bacterium 13_2_20CM_2_64_7]|jgi:hypothetical protein|nr:MAG: hypothetical protein AUI16_16730 [Alphaproteobacteria bacterium 13_2_20CM_2_64_7]